MGGDFGAVKHDSLHTGDLAVLDDQFLGGGTGQDVVFTDDGERSFEIGSPVAIGAGVLVFTIPQRADQGGLGLFEFSTHVFQPLFQALAAFDELLDQIRAAIDPGGLIRGLAQAAVIGLEDMQVQGGEQSQLGLGRAGIELGLRPVQISLDLFLQILQDGQILRMDTMLRQLNIIAGNEFVGLVELFVEGLFAPGQDVLEYVDAAEAGLDFFTDLAGTGIDAGGGIRIRRIPDQVRHDRLELTAGNQGVTANFSVLLDDQDGIAVLGRLSGCSDSCTAGADHDDINGLFNGGGSGMLNLVGLEDSQVRAAGIFSSGVHDLAQGAARKGSAGNAVHAGTIGFDHFGDHDAEGIGSNVTGFHGGGDFDGGEGGV